MATKKEPAPKKTAAKKAAVPKSPKKKPAESEESLLDRIAKKAYEIYESRGREAGRELEHWLEAEKLIKSKKK